METLRKIKKTQIRKLAKLKAKTTNIKHKPNQTKKQKKWKQNVSPVSTIQLLPFLRTMSDGALTKCSMIDSAVFYDVRRRFDDACWFVCHFIRRFCYTRRFSSMLTIFWRSARSNALFFSHLWPLNKKITKNIETNRTRIKKPKTKKYKKLKPQNNRF